MKTKIDLIRKLAELKEQKEKVIKNKHYEKAADLRAKEKEIYKELNQIDKSIRLQNTMENVLESVLDRLGKSSASELTALQLILLADKIETELTLRKIDEDIDNSL